MKNKMKKITFLCLFVAATLFVRSASAATMTIMPESSHYQGRSYFRTLTADGILSGRVEYAVYDSQGGNEFSLAGGTGRYTYAYQVFNDGEDTASALEYFAVLGIGEGAIYDLVTDISSVDDGSGGIDCTAMYFGAHDAATGPENAVWEFEGGILQTNAHSFFLVISSDYDYATGTYQVIKSTSPITPIPNPEPSTIALLGIGGMMTLVRRRKRV
ncbi:MAG: PEP-CTERM sorting domain-containing protein [Phycisphaerae bacterium]|nr:PEP-CTERM sorting domain-containing protein [Phycisphaerae bacterium]NIR63892.1 PEP-CTERM sorting domain-containing protein [candidate division Zixibacteria bacterium]NIP52015.1 PEP-CTERM sorting domain-containing protein [Phycisphaerae bacterium]NIS53792.1 PEP-CTERM sorting domain-containing protein [Phycisphaerae bacterium]NIU08750.1 PEP-CTERM sorting domain-containing protein [Phycisphaerae bacterium]